MFYMLSNREENNPGKLRKLFGSFFAFFLWLGFLFLNSVVGKTDFNSSNLRFANGFLSHNSFYEFPIYYQHKAANNTHFKSIYTDSYSEINYNDNFVGTSRGLNASIKIIPNPITGTQFEIKSSFPVVRVEIITILGSRIYLKEKADASEVISVNMKQKRQGVYLVRVKFQNGTEKVKKVVFK